MAGCCGWPGTPGASGEAPGRSAAALCTPERAPGQHRIGPGDPRSHTAPYAPPGADFGTPARRSSSERDSISELGQEAPKNFSRFAHPKARPVVAGLVLAAGGDDAKGEAAPRRELGRRGAARAAGAREREDEEGCKGRWLHRGPLRAGARDIDRGAESPGGGREIDEGRRCWSPCSPASSPERRGKQPYPARVTSATRFRGGGAWTLRPIQRGSLDLDIDRPPIDRAPERAPTVRHAPA